MRHLNCESWEKAFASAENQGTRHYRQVINARAMMLQECQMFSDLIELAIAFHSADLVWIVGFRLDHI
jgi:hypothetical protein